MNRTLATLAAVGGLLVGAAPASADPAGFVIDGPYTITCHGQPVSNMRITIYDALITSYVAPARDLCP